MILMGVMEVLFMGIEVTIFEYDDILWEDQLMRIIMHI